MLTAAYDVLGLPLGATPDQVDRAWRQFARLNHPDHGGDAAEFIRGRAAYDQLLDVFRYGYRIPVETYWELEPAYQHLTTFQRDDSLLIPSGIRFSLAVFAALLQFIFFWTRPLVLVSVLAVPLLLVMRPTPENPALIAWQMSLFGIGWIAMGLEAVALPTRCRRWLVEYFVAREERRRQAGAIGRPVVIDRCPTADQRGYIATAFVLLTAAMIGITMMMHHDNPSSTWLVVVNPFLLAYPGFWFWWVWVHDEPRARRIRPYFIGVMASLFWVMIEIADAFGRVY